MTQRVVPDTERCIDCGGCEVACKEEWGVSHAAERIEVVTRNEGQEGTMYTGGETHTPMQCYHCEESPCVEVCPTDALYVREDGLVQIEKEDCIGCTYCAWACPFGAPQYPDEETSAAGAGKMDKCTLCAERLDQGQNPACVDTCPNDALVFGTPSEISDEFRERRGETGFSDAQTALVFGSTGD